MVQIDFAQRKLDWLKLAETQSLQGKPGAAHAGPLPADGIVLAGNIALTCAASRQLSRPAVLFVWSLQHASCPALLDYGLAGEYRGRENESITATQVFALLLLPLLCASWLLPIAEKKRRSVLHGPRSHLLVQGQNRMHPTSPVPFDDACSEAAASSETSDSRASSIDVASSPNDRAFGPGSMKKLLKTSPGNQPLDLPQDPKELKKDKSIMSSLMKNLPVSVGSSKKGAQRSPGLTFSARRSNGAPKPTPPPQPTDAALDDACPDPSSEAASAAPTPTQIPKGRGGLSDWACTAPSPATIFTAASPASHEAAIARNEDPDARPAASIDGSSEGAR